MSRRTAAETLMGMRAPRASTTKTEALTAGSPLSRTPLITQASAQIFARSTSLHRWPMASSRRMPVIFSAARLKELMRQSRSTVKTPSLIESRIGSR